MPALNLAQFRAKAAGHLGRTKTITAEFSHKASEHLNGLKLTGGDGLHHPKYIHYFNILEAMAEAMPPGVSQVTVVKRPDGSVAVEAVG